MSSEMVLFPNKLSKEQTGLSFPLSCIFLHSQFAYVSMYMHAHARTHSLHEITTCKETKGGHSTAPTQQWCRAQQWCRRGLAHCSEDQGPLERVELGPPLSSLGWCRAQQCFLSLLTNHSWRSPQTGCGGSHSTEDPRSSRGFPALSLLHRVVVKLSGGFLRGWILKKHSV